MTDPDTSELGPRALYEREVAWAKKHQDVYHQRPALPDAGGRAAGRAAHDTPPKRLRRAGGGLAEEASARHPPPPGPSGR